MRRILLLLLIANTPITKLSALSSVITVDFHPSSTRSFKVRATQKLHHERCFHNLSTLLGAEPEKSTRRFVLTRSIKATLISIQTLGYSRFVEAITTAPSGVVYPSEGEIEEAIPKDWSGIDNPFDDFPQKQFSRLDNKPDSIFYAEPRFVEHVDVSAVRKMSEYISNNLLVPGDTVLDLCSSWTSHIPLEVKERLKLSSIVGLGMNEEELKANKVLDSYTVQDLNENPKLIIFPDASFDIVLCQLSIDYLTRPLDVMREVGRILKPGGRVAILFSNRLFLSKVTLLFPF